MSERAPSYSVEPLYTMFDLLMSSFRGEEVVKEEKNWNFRSPTVKYGVQSLGKEDRNAGTETFLSTKELFLEYTVSNSGRAWSTKRREELDV